MKSYEEASASWVKEYFNLSGVVTEVFFESEFEQGYGGGCPTCGYGEDPGSAFTSVKFLLDGRPKYEEITSISLTRIIKELMEQ